jgi:hypothetical protein
LVAGSPEHHPLPAHEHPDGGGTAGADRRAAQPL